MLRGIAERAPFLSDGLLEIVARQLKLRRRHMSAHNAVHRAAFPMIRGILQPGNVLPVNRAVVHRRTGDFVVGGGQVDLRGRERQIILPGDGVSRSAKGIAAVLDMIHGTFGKAEASRRCLVADPAFFFHYIGGNDAPAVFQDNRVGQRQAGKQQHRQCGKQAVWPGFASDSHNLSLTNAVGWSLLAVADACLKLLQFQA